MQLIVRKFSGGKLSQIVELANVYQQYFHSALIRQLDSNRRGTINALLDWYHFRDNPEKGCYITEDGLVLPVSYLKAVIDAHKLLSHFDEVLFFKSERTTFAFDEVIYFTSDYQLLIDELPDDKQWAMRVGKMMFKNNCVLAAGDGDFLEYATFIPEIDNLIVQDMGEPRDDDKLLIVEIDET